MGPNNKMAKRLQEIHALQSELTSSPHSHDILELAIAVTVSFKISKRIGCPPVWLMVVGVPSSDKTNTILSLRKAPHALFVDSMTENAVASGYADETGKAKRRDLLSRIVDGCIILKDLTTLFSMRQDKINKILGDLQSVFDGDYEKLSGVGDGVGWRGHVSMIGCITPIALAEHQHYLSKIGSRFVLYNVPQQTDEEHREGFDMQRQREEQAEKLATFRRLVNDHVCALLTTSVRLEPETDTQNRLIEDLSCFVAKGRAAAYWPRNEDNELELASMQVEEPYRLYAQFRVLSHALALAHGRELVTEHELDLVRRVALATIPRDRARVLEALSEGELFRSDLVETVGIGRYRLDRAVKELEYVKLVERRSGEKSGKGAHPVLYNLADGVSSLLPKGKIDHFVE